MALRQQQPHIKALNACVRHLFPLGNPGDLYKSPCRSECYADRGTMQMTHTFALLSLLRRKEHTDQRAEGYCCRCPRKERRAEEEVEGERQEDRIVQLDPFF